MREGRWTRPKRARMMPPPRRFETAVVQVADGEVVSVPYELLSQMLEDLGFRKEARE